jgi:chromosomal replication initiator protein
LNIDGVWEGVLAYVRPRIEEVQYRIWFERVRPVRLQDGVLILGVPHSFAADWLRGHYDSLIAEALQSLGGVTPRVEFTIIPQATVQDDIFTASSPNSPTPRRSPHPPLNPKYVFENFVVGENNQLAHAASLAAANAPGQAYNPLFIYGGVGLGKTHLMQAVGQYVARQHPSMVVEYASTEAFANEMITAIREDRMPAFRDRYRTVDVLLVDDVQFLAGKERTQEEFFHTFNTLHESRRQIIISSDRPPKDIVTLESRLRSRFSSGLITDIQPPELETRIAILRMNAEQRSTAVPDDVLELIARQVTSNIRELEGALMRVIAYASLNALPLERDTAQRALADIFTAARRAAPSMADILAKVADYYNVSVEQLKAPRRTRELVLPRQLAMYLIREHTQHSLPDIGAFFGGRDHTTVLHALQKVRAMLSGDPTISAAAAQIRSRLGH